MKKSSRRKKLAPSLARYGLAAGAAVTVGATPALASVVIFNAPFTVNPSQNSHAWDVDGGGATDFNIRYVVHDTGFLQASNASVGNSRAWVKNPGSAFYKLKALGTGFLIGPSLAVSNFGVTPPFGNESHPGHNQAVFTYGGGASGGLHSGTQYVGFKFLLGSQTDYGWASITISSHNITFNNWAYETSGAAIAAGAVPEPANAAAGLGLLALGAAGVSAYKRRRLNK